MQVFFFDFKLIICKVASEFAFASLSIEVESIVIKISSQKDKKSGIGLTVGSFE